MKEYEYQEEDHINKSDYKAYIKMMLAYDFYPEAIEGVNEYRAVFEHLLVLTGKAPDFLAPYEYTLNMIEQLEKILNEDLSELKEDIEQRLFEACERIAVEENIFSKKIEWYWLENRPLIRGFYRMANEQWKKGEIEKAHNLFTQLYKTNKDDQIGVRYVLKATGMNMTREEFEERFIIQGDDENYYQYPKVKEWYCGE